MQIFTIKNIVDVFYGHCLVIPKLECHKRLITSENNSGQSNHNRKLLRSILHKMSLKYFENNIILMLGKFLQFICI